IRDNTLIVFTSDNGGAYEANIGPYKGGKTDLHEGGLRVPGILSWPARLAKDKTTLLLGHHCDLLPTFCAAAGVSLPRDFQGDGVNLLPALASGASSIERGTVHWQLDLMPHIQRHYEKPRPFATEAARRGRWKMLLADGKPLALYDLEADPLEDTDVLAKNEKVAAELAADTRSFLTAPRDRRGFQ
ncbi:MAG: sulfatase-like hydrolase/transferase, partial [Bryobacteraceae bacterium]